jgi:hypothetical protein
MQVVFLVRAFTSKCYCEWELLVETVVDGKEQVFRVKDGDQPFRTTAFTTAYKTIYSFGLLWREPIRQATAAYQVPSPSVWPLTAMRRAQARISRSW